MYLKLHVKLVVRDWSLITGRKGYKTGGVGQHVKFYPYAKGGGGVEIVLAMLNLGGGAQQVLG